MYKNKLSIIFIIVALLTNCLFFNSCSQAYDGPSFAITHYGTGT